MSRTAFGFMALLFRLERERSYEACVKVAEALGWSLVEKSGSFELESPGSPLMLVYSQLDALVDDLLTAGATVLGWMPDGE